MTNEYLGNDPADLRDQITWHQAELGRQLVDNADLRAALQRIRDTCGQVCNKFELCDHQACNASYTSWAIADAALRGMTPEEDNERALREFYAHQGASSARTGTEPSP